MPSYSREECALAAAEVHMPEADELREIAGQLDDLESERQRIFARRAQLTRVLFEKQVSRKALAGLTGLTPDGVDAIRRRG